MGCKSKRAHWLNGNRRHLKHAQGIPNQVKGASRTRAIVGAEPSEKSNSQSRDYGEVRA